jgi:hypothetical protein
MFVLKDLGRGWIVLYVRSLVVGPLSWNGVTSTCRLFDQAHST